MDKHAQDVARQAERKGYDDSRVDTAVSYVNSADEGPATNSGHRNPPRHIPDFEKNQLFYLRPDFPHS